MNILELNKRAWNALAADTAWPYRKHEKYCQAFDAFCHILKPGAAVLDVGCGPGVPITRTLVDRGFEVTGLDFSENMIARARVSVPEAAFTCLSVTDMKYENMFDGVVASFSLVGLDANGFNRAARNIIRAMRPGGFCFVSLNETKPGQDIDEGGIAKVRALGQKLKLYGRRFTEQQLKDAFSSLVIVGLEREVISSERYGQENAIILMLKKETRRFGFTGDHIFRKIRLQRFLDRLVSRGSH